jgi:hypothetical protein
MTRNICSSRRTSVDPMTDRALAAAADDLVSHLTRLGPDVRAVQRLIAGQTTSPE